MSCCPTTYWCLNGTQVAVEAGADGVYQEPRGPNGELPSGGPYPTAEEAQAECGPTFDVVCYGACETTQKLARTIVLSFTDKVDRATCLPNSIPLTYGSLNIPGACTGGYVYEGWVADFVAVPGFNPPLYATKICNGYGWLAIVPVINSSYCWMYSLSCYFNNSQPEWIYFDFGWDFCTDGPVPGILGPLPGYMYNNFGVLIGTFSAYLDFGV